MRMTEKDIKNIEDQMIRMGFRDTWEMDTTTDNWKGLFGEDLPEDYYHPRDRVELDRAIDLASYIPALNNQIIKTQKI